MAKINKDEIVEFANNHYKDNHVVVYKRTKDNPNLNKIDKPPVTPIAVNRDEKSRYKTYELFSLDYIIDMGEKHN